MRKTLSQIFLLVLIALVPLALGDAGENKVDSKTAKVEEVQEAKPVKKPSNACLASEEIIQDIQIREQKLKEQETQMVERSKELDAQKKIIAEEMAKLDTARGEIQGVHDKALAEREEKVNKLIETFETMSPKAAAGVINGVDDELAVMALAKLSTTKAGKILANLNPSKSAKLSQLMAYGNVPGKEKSRVESVDRAPANSKR